MHAQRQRGSATPGDDGGSATIATAVHASRRVTSFRSRRAALNEAQQEVWDRLWPSLGRQAIPTDGDVRPLDAETWFGRRPHTGGQERSDPGMDTGGQERSDPGMDTGGQERSDPGMDTGGQERSGGLVLEIGCGTGTSTLAMAQSEPDLDVVAVEVYRRGLAQLLSAIDREGVTNIRLVRGDGIDVLERLVGPQSLTGVRVFFPDPWPKSRHHKRRLLQPATVALIADRLRPGGVLHAATDHAGYAEQIADVGDGEPLLRRVRPDESLPISVHRPTTKYETKARDAGSSVTELLWIRRNG